MTRGWRAGGVALLLVLATACVRAPVPADDALGVAELSVDFPEEGEGELSFALDCPLEVGAEVKTLTWELWLASRRFAAGLEGAPEVTRVGDGVARVAVRAPLRYRHVRWVPGAAWLQVGVAGELAVRKRGVDSTLRFRGRAEILTRGVPAPGEPGE